MANFYVSSVAYGAITAFATSHVYTVGDIIRPTAAVAGKKIAYRCTTAGTSGGSEPTWGLVFGGTTTSGGAVFTAINGDTYGWSAAAGDIGVAINASTSLWASVNDKIFLSSDHSETVSSTNLFNFLTGTWGTAPTFVISVNRGGSVPPVDADVTPGAVIAGASLAILPPAPLYVEGVTFQATSTNISLNSSSYQTTYFKNCSMQLTNSGSTNKITNANPAKIIFDNTTISFAAAGQGIVSGAYAFDIVWINTPSAIQGTAPTSLVTPAGRVSLMARGVDLSTVTGTLVTGGNAHGCQMVLDSCKIASGVTVLGGTLVSDLYVIELVNCYDGTNTRNERYHTPGKVTTERTIALTGGAADDNGAFSLKMVSNSTKIDKWVAPLASFWFDVENTATGSSKTATVEVVSSASMNNDDIWLQLEYMGTSGSPVASIANNQPSSPLASAAAVTTSSATWASSPSTPVYQKLQVVFTPQVAGRVRACVMLGKASTTVYVNPVIVIT